MKGLNESDRIEMYVSTQKADLVLQVQGNNVVPRKNLSNKKINRRLTLCMTTPPNPYLLFDLEYSQLEICIRIPTVRTQQNEAYLSPSTLMSQTHVFCI